MVIYELNKILGRKLVLIVSVLAMGIVIFMSLDNGYDKIKERGDIDAYYALATPYIGKINIKIGESMSNEVNKILSNEDNIEGSEISMKLPPEERRRIRFTFSYGNAYRRYQQWQNDKMQEGTDELGKQIAKNIVAPGYYINDAWEIVYSFIGGPLMAILISIVLILALAPSFAYEREINTEYIVLATVGGEDAIVSSKIIAAMIFTFIYVTISYALVSLASLVPLKGYLFLNNPINSLENYRHINSQLTVGQLLIVGYILVVVASFLQATIVLLVSALNKNVITAFSIGFILNIVFLLLKVGVNGIQNLLPINMMMFSGILGEQANGHIGRLNLNSLSMVLLLGITDARINNGHTEWRFRL